MAQQLSSWTVYKYPADFPDKFVARRFDGDQPTHEHFADKDVEKVREWIFKEALSFDQGSPHKLRRSSEDDPVIFEIWI